MGRVEIERADENKARRERAGETAAVEAGRDGHQDSYTASSEKWITGCCKHTVKKKSLCDGKLRKQKKCVRK